MTPFADPDLPRCQGPRQDDRSASRRVNAVSARAHPSATSRRGATLRLPRGHHTDSAHSVTMRGGTRPFWPRSRSPLAGVRCGECTFTSSARRGHDRGFGSASAPPGPRTIPATSSGPC